MVFDRSLSFSLAILLVGTLACQAETEDASSSQPSQSSTACQTPETAIEPPEPATAGPLSWATTANATAIAVASGPWSERCTWAEGRPPSPGARVLIPKGVTVTVDQVIDVEFKVVVVHGRLTFAHDRETELRVDTLVTAMSGQLEVGREGQPIAADVAARIVFVDGEGLSAVEDPDALSRGAILMGQTRMHGARKTHRAVATAKPRKGDAVLALDRAPEGWAVGDAVVIAGTDADDPESDEQRTIAALDGVRVTLNEPLAWDHTAPADDLEVHVANLTRNIEVSSESAELASRGHVMFMHSLDVAIFHVRFERLGRTDKRVQLDDWIFPDLLSENAEPGPGTSRRGRYSVHFHRGGVTLGSDPAHVEGCVVEDDPGWAYVNHSSHVDFVNNVSYNVVGGAFQTESGDEQGSFVGNIAIRTVNPDFPLLDPETAPVDIRENSQDFAFQGDGFWIHGGGVRLEDNVATGCSGHGFIFWTEGIREVDTQFDELNKFLTANIPNGELITEVDSVNTWWVPLAAFEGNRTYSVSKGLAAYYIHSTLFEDIHDLSEAYLATVHSTLEDLHIWNVALAGIHLENSERFTFRDVRLLNSGESAVTGIHTQSTVGNRTIWDNVSVEGFQTGMMVPTQGNVTIRGGTWRNVIDFFITPPQFEPRRQGDNRDLLISDVTFEDLLGVDPVERANVYLAGAETIAGQLAMLNEEDAHRLALVPDRIVLSSNRHPEQQLYFAEQAPDVIPLEAGMVSPEAYGSYLEEVVGQTNQDLADRYGLAFAGWLLPEDAAEAAGVVGGFGAAPHGEPLNIPTCLFIDEPPPPSNTFDGFDFYACWDEAGGVSGQVAPFDHTLD